MLFINIQCGSGFGNILFMVLNGLNLSLKYNMKLNLIDYNQTRADRPNFKKYDIFKSFDIIDKNNLPKNIIEITEQTEFHYDKIILNPQQDYLISGYFQSYKYFYENIDIIKKILFNRCSEKYESCKKYFDSITQKDKKNIMIHIRRGDYIIQSSYLIDKSHFEKTLDLFFKTHNRIDYNIYLFTENIEEIKYWDFYKKYVPIFIDENDPEKIFLLMTLFDHYIISNSSLSLSAYYLRQNIKAKITMPPIWVDGYFNYDDIIPIKENHIDILNKLKNTYIINLDYRVDRKYKSRNEVEKLSADIKIFNAIKDSRGAIGCTKSHIEVLKYAIDLDLEYVFICEDDIKILNDRYVLFGINEIMTNFDWDVIIVSGVSRNEIKTYNKFVNKVTDCQTTTSYIVNKKYMKKLLNNFIEGLENLIKTNNKSLYAIDIYWKLLQKTDKFYCINKKYVYQHSDLSDIENKYVNYKHVFNIENIKINEYILNIPIIDINNINDIKNINKFYLEYENIIINLNSIKICDKFIKIKKEDLILNEYDLIQLQNSCDSNNFNKFIKSDSIFNDDININCKAFLLKNNLLKKILNKPDDYILNNNFIYDNIKCCKLNKPLFLAGNDKIWFDYYNSIIIDKIAPIIYKNKIKNLIKKINNNEQININYSQNAIKWYKNIVGYIMKLYNCKQQSNICDIFITTDNDSSKLNDNNINILISGEPTEINYDLYDIVIGSTIKKENYITIPIPFMILSLNERRQLNKKYFVNFTDKKMCAFMYKVDYAHRIEIFNKFSNRMKVDSFGQSCNNINVKFTRNIYNENETYNDIAVKIYSEYKFVLAIENTIKQGYNTEKLINPILANSIPIYYGSSDIFNIINKKRVIFFDDFENINKLIDCVIEISQNEQKYNEIINEKIFIRNDINLGNYNEFIERQINILSNINKNIDNIYNTNTKIDSVDSNFRELKYNENNTNINTNINKKLLIKKILINKYKK